MNTDKIILYLLISLAISIGAVIMGKVLFVWFEERMLGPKKYKGPSIDVLIARQEKLLRRGKPEIKPVKQKASEQLEESTDPGDLELKKIIQKIYSFNPQKLPEEDEYIYFRRVLDIPASIDAESLKKAYKNKSKDFHPDMYPLDKFDTKAKKRLKGRIHENYLAIQKAYEGLKKKI